MGAVATILMLCLLMQSLDCFPKPPNPKKPFDTEGYLKKFGYMKKGTTMSQGLQSFQKFYDLKVTGKLDDATKKLMGKSRCGVPDDPQDRDAGRKRRSFSLRILNRQKRYVASQYSWNPLFSKIGEKRLRWILKSTGTQSLPRDEILRILRNSFAAWAAQVAGFIFEEVTSGDYELEIYFASYLHPDGSSFDGPGGVLAHAYYPYDINADLAGDAHFDDSETYTDGVSTGVNFYFVALHEIGHSLGLGHSRNTDAVMYAYYRGYVPNLTLQPDDINGIKAIYGDGSGGGGGGGKKGCKGRGKKKC